MSSRGLTEKQLLRRATILSKARELIEKDGYSGVTMRALADHAGVALKTLYDVYGSKDALLARAIEERARVVFEGLDDESVGRGFDRLMKIAERQCRAAREVPNLTKSVAPILMTDPTAFNIGAAYMRYHRQAVREIHEQGDLEEWADTDLLVRLMLIDQNPITFLWASGEISGDDLYDFTVMMMGQVLLPATTGRTREQIASLLAAAYRKWGRWGRGR